MNDFNKEITSEEEFQTLLNELKEYKRTMPLNKEEAIVNPNNLNIIKGVYRVLRFLMRDTDVKVTYKLNDTLVGAHNITLEGETLSFKNSEAFACAAKLASNFEVYPLVKDRVRISFSFYGLTESASNI